MADAVIARTRVRTNSPAELAHEERKKPGPKKTWVLTALSTKSCNQCCQFKSIDQFSPERRGICGVSAKCKSCRNLNRKGKYPSERDRILATVAAYRSANPEKARLAKRAAMEKKPEHYRSKSSRWKKNNPERVNANERARRARRGDELRPLNRANQKRFYQRKRLDKSFALNRSFSSSIYKCLTGSKRGKSWKHLVPYSSEELRVHLEKQFLPRMSWDNYGCSWHVDHILPVSSFSFETAECPDFKACWALANLRPLWKHDNQVKSARRTLLL